VSVSTSTGFTRRIYTFSQPPMFVFLLCLIQYNALLDDDDDDLMNPSIDVVCCACVSVITDDKRIQIAMLRCLTLIEESLLLRFQRA